MDVGCTLDLAKLAYI